jgi:PAS domain S-box-containing protein
MNASVQFSQFTPSRVATGCALIVGMIGLTGMAGWAFGIESLIRLHPELASMKFNTALCIFLLGAGLFGRGWPAWRIGCGLVTALVAFLTLGQHLTGFDFGIDQLFVRDTILKTMDTSAPGRISPMTALCFACCGMALALLRAKINRSQRTARIFALTAGGIAGIALLGYGIGASMLYSLPGLGTVALQAAMAIVLLALGLHFADREGSSLDRKQASPTQRYLWIGFGILTALLIADGIVSALSLQNISRNIYDLTAIDRERSVAAREMEINLLDYSLAVGDALTGIAGAREHSAEEAATVAKHLATYERLALTPKQQELAREFTVQWEAIQGLGQSLLASNRADPSAQARLATARLAVENLLDNVIQPDSVAEFDIQSTALVSDMDTTQRVTLMLLIASIVIALISSAYLSRGMLRTEQGLRESEERLKLATETAQVGIWEIDLKTNKRFWDDCMYDLYRARREDFPEPYDLWAARLHPEDKRATDAALRDAIANHKKYAREFRLKMPDGEIRFIKGQAQVIRDNAGKRLRIMGTNLDITDVKLAAQALAARDAALDASKLKSDFLATMSHEIRTPMNGVIGATDLLLHSALDESQRDLAQMASDSGNALLTLIDDILDFSKMEAGKLKIETIAFEPASVVTDAVRTLDLSAQSKQLKLSSFVDPAVPTTLLGDPGRLRQILLNLIGNAIKFTSSGEVSIRVVRKSAEGKIHRIRFEVRDTGIGLTRETADTLFTPFTQADGSSQRRFGGTGLGLAICKQLVTHMGGQIEFDLTVSQGALIWLEVPLEQAPAARGMMLVQHNAISTSSRGNALVVDDNQINQKIAEALLTNLGYTCHSVENGQLAVEAMQADCYDLVMMDCQMPVMDGYEATGRIRMLEKDTGRHVPIIAMTAHAMSGTRERCLESGMDDYLTKPFNILALRNILLRWFPEGGAKAAVNY